MVSSERPLVRELLNDGQDVAVFHRDAEVSSNQKPLQIRGHRNRLPDYEDELRRFAPEVIIDMVLCSGERAGPATDRRRRQDQREGDRNQQHGRVPRLGCRAWERTGRIRADANH